MQIKTLKHNGVEVNKTKTIRTFALNSFPLFKQADEDVDSKNKNNDTEFNSSFGESVSNTPSKQEPKREVIKLKLRGVPRDYIINPNNAPSSGWNPNLPQNYNIVDQRTWIRGNNPNNMKGSATAASCTLKARLFCKTLEKIFSKRITSFQSYFLSQLRIDHANYTCSLNLEKRLTFTHNMRGSPRKCRKNVQRAKVSRLPSNTHDTASVGSTKGSTIFGLKELNLIYQNNSLE